jgi:glutamate synthase (NADPH/NADH) large chain
MFLAEAISDFFLDLKDERFVSRYAIFHQRFSTNTAPSWNLAQPFRAIAHNGEINTYRGNKNWMKVHEQEMNSPLFDNIENLKPVIQQGASDSAALDNVFELLNISGQPAPLAKLMLVPDAWSKKNKTLSRDHQQLFNFLNSTMEPWDGPAAIAGTDNEWVIAANDRNGLRPLRYAITKDNLLFAGSETGMIELNEKKILTKGRLGPGEIIGVRIEKGKVFTNSKIKDYLAKEYKHFNSQIIDLDEKITISGEKHSFSGDDLRRRQYTFGMSLEDLELILHPMAEDAKEAIGSMGDDTPLAVLSDKYRPLYHFFRQNFSQVTNPPIDSLRENKVMSLKTRFGNLGNILDFDNLTKQNIYVLNSPILSNSQFDKFINFFGKNSLVIDCTFSKDQSLFEAIKQVQKDAEIAVRQGVTQLILSDKGLSETNLPIPMLLCVGAINSFLIEKKLRGYVSINVQSGEALDTHSFATLIGVGATTVNPYLAFDSLYQRHEKKLFGKFSFDECVERYIKSVNAGLLKIMSKMGISVLSSYRGGCNFETVGLSRTIVADYFPGVVSKISGIGLTGIEKKIRSIHKEAFESSETILPIGGIYRYRKNGETHQYQGKLIHLLQSAVGSNSYEAYKRYAEGIYNLPPINLRDLIDFRSKKLKGSIDISEVEPIQNILKRFGSGSMSHGALSKEAHETLATGMNRIKGASCSGEGGEDESRFKVLENGDSANSRVKQIASARFGVTVNYLNNCNEIEIKIAQGAKPGEGGQLPGFKVTDEIAKLRHSTPGVTLISPPPHHDIYSIEDLAQLIYDLKQINPIARIGVKLVASSGVGTIAAGVAKAKADIILISGHNGGTGATPQTSVKYVGIPWEMGLTEANQVLTLNNLRHKVTLRTDGGIKTGRDVVIAAMMGAEEYGVATTALVAMGCIMVRQCHSNTCPVGVCTQDEKLREKFTGTPDKVVNLFTFIASEVREILAKIGFKSLNDIIGRTDLLMQVSKASPNLDDLDLNPLFVQADNGNNKRYCENQEINHVPDTLDQEIWPEIEKSLDSSEKIEKEYIIKNTNRAVGTRISHHLYKKYGYEKLNENFLVLNFKGSAGQSFGAFSAKGLKLVLKGDANDYVGKGLSGATISIKLSDESNLISNENTIIGNTVLYGATSGKLFAAGQAGERFAVRNSGATTVIEGCDSNGCEYMTGGTVVILGDVGDNFAAGMTGGMAFIYDKSGEFEKKVNDESVVWQNIETDYWKTFLKDLIQEHFKETGSNLSKMLIENYDEELKNFIQVCPKEMLDKLSNPISNKPFIKEVS